MKQWHRMVPTPNPPKSQVQEPSGQYRASYSWTCSLQWALEFRQNPAQLYVNTEKERKKKLSLRHYLDLSLTALTFESGTPTMHLHRSENSNITRGREMPWKSTVTPVIFVPAKQTLGSPKAAWFWRRDWLSRALPLFLQSHHFPPPFPHSIFK